MLLTGCTYENRPHLHLHMVMHTKIISKLCSADLKLHQTCSDDPALKQIGINLCGAIHFGGEMKWWQSQGNEIGSIIGARKDCSEEILQWQLQALYAAVLCTVFVQSRISSGHSR